MAKIKNNDTVEAHVNQGEGDSPGKASKIGPSTTNKGAARGTIPKIEARMPFVPFFVSAKRLGSICAASCGWERRWEARK